MRARGDGKIQETVAKQKQKENGSSRHGTPATSHSVEAWGESYNLELDFASDPSARSPLLVTRSRLTRKETLVLTRPGQAGRHRQL